MLAETNQAKLEHKKKIKQNLLEFFPVSNFKLLFVQRQKIKENKFNVYSICIDSKR